jgi:hypothetical protein
MLDIVARLKDLAAAIFTRLQVDVVRAAQFAGVRVFDVGIHRQAVVRTAHAAAGLRFLTLWDCHDRYPELLRQMAHVNWKRASYRAESDFARLERHAAGLFFSPADPPYSVVSFAASA